jgi:hypothetical protein
MVNGINYEYLEGQSLNSILHIGILRIFNFSVQKVKEYRSFCLYSGMFDFRNYVYSSPNILRVIKPRRMRWAGNVARMGEEREVYRVLVGIPGGKRPLGRPRR